MIERANDTTYGLAAAIFTTSLDVANQFYSRVKAGTVWWAIVMLNHLYSPMSVHSKHGMIHTNLFWGQFLYVNTLSASTE